jgi:hypothetical protein
VNINDKFSKIIHYFEAGTNSSLDKGSFVVNKNIIEFSADESLEKNYVIDN